MHYNSMGAMKKFTKEYLHGKKNLKILDVGALCVGERSIEAWTWRRCTRGIENCQYIGVDISAGKGVDVVAEDMYSYPFADGSFDVVISGNTMEHVMDLHKWIKELSRITNDLLFITAPAYAKEHRHPVDCWRVLPDGMRFLIEEIAGMTVVELGILNNRDTVCVAVKKDKHKAK